jgi:hypothetical protein
VSACDTGAHKVCKVAGRVDAFRRSCLEDSYGATGREGIEHEIEETQQNERERLHCVERDRKLEVYGLMALLEVAFGSEGNEL